MLPRNSKSYGIIHADLHFQNLFLSDSGLELVDFDNCEYGFFFLDFATLLYDCTFNRLRAGSAEAFAPQATTRIARELWLGVATGYAREYDLVTPTVADLSMALCLRELLRYTYYLRTTEVAEASPGFVAGLKEMRERIEEGRSPLSVEEVLLA